jgi:hypothetical protein
VLILEMTNQIYPVPLVRSLQGINNNNSNRTSHCTLISNSKPINERAEIAAFSGVYTTTPLGWRWEKRTHYLYKNNDMDTREKKKEQFNTNFRIINRRLNQKYHIWFDYFINTQMGNTGAHNKISYISLGVNPPSFLGKI